MSIYRVIFSNNTIAAIKPVQDDYHLEGELFYYQNKGLLVYAIIKAEDEPSARRIATDLIVKVESR